MYSKLPFVTFEYPDSSSEYLRTRYVRVVSMDHTHVKGYEFQTDSPSDTDEGKFKSYLLAKIVNDGVALMEFDSSDT